MTESPTRPIVRYHGGKWKLAPWIIRNLPVHRIYVEPFGGAASVLLQKERSYAEVYNDKDAEIVNLFLMARSHGEKLADALRLTPFSRDEFELSYTQCDDPMEQARRTVARAFMGFGSNSHSKATGFRSNSNRSGTTPAMDWKNYPECFTAIVNRLRGVVIENRDYAKILGPHDTPQTVFYVDPPYVQSTRDAGGDYRFEMTDDDHAVLASELKQLTGMVVLSGYDCGLYSELYSGWRKISTTAQADGARDRTECLWISPNAITRTQQPLFT